MCVCRGCILLATACQVALGQYDPQGIASNLWTSMPEACVPQAVTHPSTNIALLA